MIKKYKIDNNNLINFELMDNFAIIHFIHFDNPNNLFTCMKEYFDYIASLEGIEFLGSYPGCSNSLIVKAGIDVVKHYGFNYRIFYDKNEVDNITQFENKVLNLNIEKIQPIINTMAFAKGLNFAITNLAISNGFKNCAVFSPVKKNYEYVSTPIRYYEMDKDNFLTLEYSEKPKNNKKYYQTVGINKMLLDHNIQIVDEKPRYSKRNK